LSAIDQNYMYSSSNWNSSCRTVLCIRQ